MIRGLCLFHRDLLGEEPEDFGTPADFLTYLNDQYAETVAWFRAFVGGITDRTHEMAPVLEEALAVLSRAGKRSRKGISKPPFRLAPEGAVVPIPADRTKTPRSSRDRTGSLPLAPGTG